LTPTSVQIQTAKSREIGKKVFKHKIAHRRKKSNEEIEIKNKFQAEANGEEVSTQDLKMASSTSFGRLQNCDEESKIS